MSEVADRYIAIKRGRRSSRGRRAAPRRALAATAGAELAGATVALESADFEPAPELAELPEALDAGGFVPIPHASSVIVEPPVGTSADDVRALLGDEYLVMPDVQMTLPGLAATETIAPGDVRRPDELLAAETGLAAEAELPQATPLSSLVVKGSPRALAEIDKAPIVKQVMPISPDATLKLIDE